MLIYKYVTGDRVDILEKGLIRFTQPLAFNDPIKMRPYISSMASNSFILDTLNTSYPSVCCDIYSDLPEFIKQNISFSTFSRLAENKWDTLSY